MGRIVDLALYLPKGTSKDYLDENENKKMSRAEMQKKIMQCKALYDFYCHECRVQLTVDKRGYWRVKNKQHDKNCTYGYEYKSFNYERRQGKHSLLEAPKVVPLQIKTSLSKSSSAPETKKPKQYSNTISRLKSKYSSKKRENFYIRTVDEYFYHIKEAKEKGMITELYRVFAREKIS
ncbi:hypothetical protein GWP49_31685, partial [Klebsiella pneumoniae]|nr:hypothetical protein [Klebsiella pneumoniae]